MGEVRVVRPEDGAEAVDFSHAAAGDAVAALSTMAGILDDQAAVRIGPRDHVVTDWRGRLRDEFDRAWELLQARLQTRAGHLRYRLGSIHAAVDNANGSQLRLNREARELADDAASS